MHGGEDAYGNVSGDLPVAMPWTDLSDAASGMPPTARNRHGFTSAGGKLEVHGGQGANFNVVGDLHSFDPVAVAWIAPMPVCARKVGDGRAPPFPFPGFPPPQLQREGGPGCGLLRSGPPVRAAPAAALETQGDLEVETCWIDPATSHRSAIGKLQYTLMLR